ncbi:MAG: hypothetical protein ACLSGF_05070 [Alistipes onderdonkii]
MQDVSYIRLKNLTVDYTFPAHICRKMRIKGLKVYVSGENLWTSSPMFKYCTTTTTPRSSMRAIPISVRPRATVTATRCCAP